MHYCSFISLSFECFVMQQQLTYAGTPTQIPPYILPRPRMELLHKWNQLRLNFHKHAHYWVNNITLPSTGEKGWRWSKWSWGRNLQLLSANYTISLLLHRAGGEGDGMLEMSPTLGTVCNAWSHMPTNAQTLEFSYFWNSRLLLYVTDGSAFHILSPHPDPVCQLLGTLLSSSRNFLPRKSWSGEGSSLCLGERALSPASTIWAVRVLTLAIVEDSPGRKWDRWVLPRDMEMDTGPGYTMGIGSGS